MKVGFGGIPVVQQEQWASLQRSETIISQLSFLLALPLPSLTSELPE